MRLWRLITPLFAFLFLTILAGCAMQPVAPAVHLLGPTSRVSVLQLPAAVGDDAVRDVFHPGKKQIPPDALAVDRQTLQQIVDAALRKALAQATAPSLASASVAASHDLPAMTVGMPLDASTLATLQVQDPADAYLRVQVTDYGRTPGTWKGAYVTFEVVTTLAIGALLYAHKVTRALAGVYLVQEGVEEFGEGYAGFWLINRLSRPVRIEADLVDGKTGKVLWQDSETGMAGWTWGHLWHMDEGTRDDLLKASAERMATDWVTELEGR